MSSSILQFLLGNAIAIASGLALLSLLLFAQLHRMGYNLAAAIFAVIVSILYIFVPIFGGYLTIITALMVNFIRTEHLWLACASVVINTINILTLSPLLKANATGGVKAGDHQWAIYFIILLVVQIIFGIKALLAYIDHKKEEALMEPFDCEDDGEVVG